MADTAQVDELSDPIERFDRDLFPASDGEFVKYADHLEYKALRGRTDPWERIATLADQMGAPTEVQDEASLIAWVKELEAKLIRANLRAASLEANNIDTRDRQWFAALKAAGVTVKQ